MSARLNAVCSGTRAAAAVRVQPGVYFGGLSGRFAFYFGPFSQLPTFEGVMKKIDPRQKKRSPSARPPPRPLLRWSGSCRLSLTRESTCLALGSSRNTGR